MVKISVARRGQLGLEYIFLVGIVAAAIIAIIVYIGRGKQGQVRSQADQLSESQYAPGKTAIHSDTEHKAARSSNSSASATTTKNPEHPVGEKNEALEGTDTTIGLYDQQQAAMQAMYNDMNAFDLALHPEGAKVASWVSSGNWPWSYNASPAGNCLEIEIRLQADYKQLNYIRDLINANVWPPRQPSVSTSGSSSSEKGNIDDTKHTNETMGDL